MLKKIQGREYGVSLMQSVTLCLGYDADFRLYQIKMLKKVRNNTTFRGTTIPSAARYEFVADARSPNPLVERWSETIDGQRY